MISDKSKNISIPIWDSWIRLFHWSLACSIAFLLLSGKTGYLFFEWHRQIGEFALALLLFRLLWSIFGSSNAGLLSLVVHPKYVLSHLLSLLRGRVRPERGHNSAGGWAILSMLLLIGFQAVSGMLIADEDELIEGRFYGFLDESTTESLLHLHHLNANIILGIVLLHIVMIGVYWIRAKQNLVSAMITGNLSWPRDVSVPAYQSQKWWVGFVLIVLTFAIVGTVSKWW